MSESAGDDQDLFPRTVGQQLAAARRSQNLELSDVAARTRIPLRHLEAIETGQHNGLPALPYSAGFVKSYANMLGLNGQLLSRAFREEIGDERRAYFEPEAYEPVDASRVPSRLLAMIALGVALLLGMGYLLLRFEGDASDLAKLAADTVQDNRPVPRKPAPPPVPVEPAAPAIPTGPISVVASEDVWVKVSERETGKIYFMNVLPLGQSVVLPEDASDPILRTGRPQSLKVLVGQTELPPIGEPDRLVRAYSLKRDALIAILVPPAAAVEGDNASEPVAVPAAGAPAAAPVPPAFRRTPRRVPAPAAPADEGLPSAEPTTDSGGRAQP